MLFFTLMFSKLDFMEQLACLRTVSMGMMVLDAILSLRA